MVGRAGDFAYNPASAITSGEDKIMCDDDHPTEPEETAPAADVPAAVQWMMQQAAAGQSAAALPAPAARPPVSSLAPGQTEPVLADRRRRISDALRGNDRLTEGLPADAADSLMELGLDLARRVVQDTSGLDDGAAEDILQPRVRAVRRLMMAAAEATRQVADAAGLGALLEQATVALGDQFRQPGAADELALRREWMALAGKPEAQIAALHRFIERFTSP